MSTNHFYYERYANSMMFRGHGHGFYDPPSNSDARPGICGYIDDGGIWQKMVDLKDDTAVNDLKLSNLGTVQLKPTEKQTWGPLHTNTVKRTDVQVGANLSLSSLGVPLDCSGVLKYSLNSSFGAILLCNDAVEMDSYGHKDTFMRWAKANAELLRKIWPDITNHGFYVMTSTWSARDIYINSLHNQEDNVVIGFKAMVPGAGGVGLSTEYYRGQSGGNWHHPIVTGDERKVIFFGGIHLSFNKLFRRFNKQDQVEWTGYRGAGDTFLVRDGDDAYEVQMSVVSLQ
ncbi:hypothetical protein BJY01DRAFT_252974 [Aspergillus pseudoustus]|uniref:Uncharacterized protein n=1 Tax=Aspergillus pseudoustus TaxID=1810923 RepID=A0ABR4J3N8_9EURO